MLQRIRQGRQAESASIAPQPSHRPIPSFHSLARSSSLIINLTTTMQPRSIHLPPELLTSILDEVTSTFTLPSAHRAPPTPTQARTTSSHRTIVVRSSSNDPMEGCHSRTREDLRARLEASNLWQLVRKLKLEFDSSSTVDSTRLLKWF